MPVKIARSVLDDAFDEAFDPAFEKFLRDIILRDAADKNYDPNFYVLSGPEYYKLVGKLFDLGPINQSLKELAQVVGFDVLVASGVLKADKKFSQKDFGKMMIAVKGARSLYEQEYQYVKATLIEISTFFKKMVGKEISTSTLAAQDKNFKNIWNGFLDIPRHYWWRQTFLKNRTTLHDYFDKLIIFCEQLTSEFKIDIDVTAMRQALEGFVAKQKSYDKHFIIEAASSASLVANRNDSIMNAGSQESKKEIVAEVKDRKEQQSEVSETRKSKSPTPQGY